jgi:hypothetical protein
MKKESKILLDKAVASLILSVEHFNEPSDVGRVEAVLIFMDHAYEMLLKAAILHKGGRIRQPRAKQTIGFDHCVRTAVSDGKLKFLSEEDALLLQANNSLRDAAQHHLLSISEPHLYIQAQAGLSLFKRLLNDVFGKDLRLALPARVLPLSTTPPQDLSSLFQNEVEEIRKLLGPRTRRKIEALAKIRALAIVEGAVNGERLQPSQNELTQLSVSIKKGKNWEDIFPGVATINITATGQGPSIDLRITKKEGIPVVLVKEGTPGAAVVALKRVNELDFYNLGLNDLAKKVNLSPPRTTAVIQQLKLQGDPEMFKKIQIGKMLYNRYSQHAVTKISDALQNLKIEEVWANYRNAIKGRKKLVAESRMPKKTGT